MIASFLTWAGLLWCVVKCWKSGSIQPACLWCRCLVSGKETQIFGLQSSQEEICCPVLSAEHLKKCCCLFHRWVNTIHNRSWKIEVRTSTEAIKSHAQYNTHNDLTHIIELKSAKAEIREQRLRQWGGMPFKDMFSSVMFHLVLLFQRRCWCV